MSQLDPFLQEFLALYEEGGVAHGLLERSKGILLRGTGAESEHEIGRHRGVIQGLEGLRNQIVELAKREKQQARQGSDEPAGAATNRPLRRVH